MPYKDLDKQRAWQREYQRRRKAKGLTPSTADKRKYRQNWELKHPERVHAKASVNRRVKRKHWPKASVFKCTDCNSQAAQYHHEDYSLWWSIEPLCVPCHGKRHRKADQ